MSADSDSCLTLTMPSDLDALPVVRSFVESVCRLAALDDRSRYEVILAANEACSNAMRHAHGGDRRLPVVLSCRVLDDGVEVRVRDLGEPFALDEVPDLDPRELRMGGRGVFLIRRLMDEVSCVRHADGNELRMVKRRTPSGDI